MKSITMPKTVQLNEETKKQLEQEANQVNETVANTEAKDKTSFSVVDMWNCQRQSKSASAMMRRWNLN